MPRTPDQIGGYASMLSASPDIHHPNGVVDKIEALEVVVAYLQQPAIPVEQLASILWQGVYAPGISAAEVCAGILLIPVPVSAPQSHPLRVGKECVLDDPRHREIVEGLRPELPHCIKGWDLMRVAPPSRDM